MIYFQKEDLPLMCLKSPNGPVSAAETFDRLESKLDSLRGRKFYGLFRIENGQEIYLACTRVEPGDSVDELGFENAILAGGKYERERINGWEDRIKELPAIFSKMGEGNDVDSSRYTVEFYRSTKELILMLPVR